MFGLWSKRGAAGPDGGPGDPFGKPLAFEDYDEQLQKGLPPAELAEIRDAYASLRYANGHFDDADAARSGSGPSGAVQGFDKGRFDLNDLDPGSEAQYDKADFRLYPPVMQRICAKLSEHLYKREPSRVLDGSPRASAVLNQIYQRNAMAAKWQEADRLTAIGGYAGFQFAGSDDPQNPVKIHLWSRDQLVVWPDEDDPTKPAAVFTMDVAGRKPRGTLWTPEKVGTYVGRRSPVRADDTRQFERVRVEPNPYRDEEGIGFLPFSFAHWRFPATEFTSDCPGTRLRELNRYILHGFDSTADGVRYLVRPIGVAEGVDDEWDAPTTIKPGMFLRLPAAPVDGGGNGVVPNLRWATPDSQWVSVVWAHLNQMLDNFLELEGIPPSTIRMVMDARSGVSILAEAAPLLSWTEQRRRPFGHYERSAAKTCLMVLAAHAAANGLNARDLWRVAAESELTLHWPRLYVDLPGPERDRADGIRLQWGLASLLDLMVERDSCTREQALEKLKQVKQDNDDLRAIGIEPVPAAAQQGGGFGGGSDGGDALGWNEQQDQIAAGPKPVDGEPVDVNAQADALSGEGG